MVCLITHHVHSGTWVVHIQAKSLPHQPTQKYAVVITSQGKVAPATTGLKAISPMLLESCMNTGGTPSVTPRLEVTHFINFI